MVVVVWCNFWNPGWDYIDSLTSHLNHHQAFWMGSWSCKSQKEFIDAFSRGASLVRLLMIIYIYYIYIIKYNIYIYIIYIYLFTEVKQDRKFMPIDTLEHWLSWGCHASFCGRILRRATLCWEEPWHPSSKFAGRLSMQSIGQIQAGPSSATSTTSICSLLRFVARSDGAMRCKSPWTCAPWMRILEDTSLAGILTWHP